MWLSYKEWNSEHEKGMKKYIYETSTTLKGILFGLLHPLFSLIAFFYTSYRKSLEPPDQLTHV